MKLETTVINNTQVEDTGKTMLGHKVFKEKRADKELYDLKLFFVDDYGNVVSEIVVEADYDQCTGYVSDWHYYEHQ